MAIEILEGGKGHNYYHDLESLFYVLIWVCTMYSGPCGALRDKTFTYKKSVLSVWNGEMTGASGHFPFVAWSKRAVMMHPATFNEEILKNFAPYFEPIKEDVKKLREALFPIPLSTDMVEAIEEVLGDEPTADSISKAHPRLLKLLRALLPASRQVPSDLFSKMRGVLDKAIDRLTKDPSPDSSNPFASPISTSQRYPGIFGKTYNVLQPYDIMTLPAAKANANQGGKKRQPKARAFEDASPTKKLRSDPSSSSSYVLVPRTPSTRSQRSCVIRSQQSRVTRSSASGARLVRSQGTRSGKDTGSRDDPFRL